MKISIAHFTILFLRLCSYIYAQERCISMYDLNKQGHLVNFTTASWKNMTVDASLFCIKYGIGSKECDILLATHRHMCITNIYHKGFTGCASEVRVDGTYSGFITKSPDSIESEAHTFCDQNLLFEEECDRIIAHHRQSCIPMLLPPTNTNSQCKTDLMLFHANNVTQVASFSTQSFGNINTDADTFCFNHHISVQQCELLIMGHREKCIAELILDEIPNYIDGICSSSTSSCDKDTPIHTIQQIIEVGTEKRRNTTKSSSYNHNTFHSVNSFDIFDTIIARDVEYPQDIFTIIENQYPLPHFRQFRMDAESLADGTYDGIYRQLQRLLNMSDTETKALKQYEFATELNHTYLIRETYERVKDGDILVTDMYLPYDHIHQLLSNAGFQKKINLYVSYGEPIFFSPCNAF